MFIIYITINLLVILNPTNPTDFILVNILHELIDTQNVQLLINT